MTTESAKQRIEAEWRRLGGSREHLDALQSFITMSNLPATLGIVADEVVVTLIHVDASPRERFETFTMGIAAAARSQAEREIDARHQATHSLIDGIVDSLELRYRADQAAEELRALSGGESGPAGLFYDLVDLGSRTLRELLHLNARANRRLLTALQTLGPSAPPLTVRVGDRAVLRLVADKAATLTLENQLVSELTVSVPTELSVCRQDGTGATLVALKADPQKVTLRRGERRDIALELATHETHQHTLLGELLLGGSEGKAAIIPVVIPGPEGP